MNCSKHDSVNDSFELVSSIGQTEPELETCLINEPNLNLAVFGSISRLYTSVRACAFHVAVCVVFFNFDWSKKIQSDYAYVRARTHLDCPHFRNQRSGF